LEHGKLTYKPGGVVEYMRPDGWTVRAEVGWDEAKQAEVLDLRKVEKWFPGDDPLGLKHDPLERREVTTPDLLEIDDVFTRNYGARRRPLLIIYRDGSGVLREPPPEQPLIVTTGPEAAPVLVRSGRKPNRGLVANKTAMAAVALTTLSIAGGLGVNMMKSAGVWRGIGMVVVCAGMLLAVGAGAAMLYESYRFRTRRRLNQCVECGYSRAKLAPEAACPECGAGHWYQ
jgi:hypothetical protein